MPKLPQAIGEFMEKLNDVLNDWEDLEYKPNAVTQVENMLDNFYSNNLIEVNDSGRFDTDLSLTEEQQDELYNIAQFAQNQDIYLEDFEAKFESAQGKHGLETLEDYAEFVDLKTRFEDSILSSSKLSYYEYEALQKKASKDKRRTESGTNKMIREAFLNKGLTGSDLYDYVYKKLSKKR